MAASFSFSFSSLTTAQKGRRLLQSAGISALIRKHVRPQSGCFYELVVPQNQQEQAKKLLEQLPAMGKAAR